MKSLQPVCWIVLFAGLAGAGAEGMLAQAADQSECSVAKLKRFRFSEVQMGAPWNIILYAPNQTAAEAAARAAFARVAQLNGVLSNFDDDSELTRLARTAPANEPIPLSDDLWKVLKFSQDLARRTDGAFDITVGPMTRLWRRARRSKEMPSAERLAEARRASGYEALVLDCSSKSARLLKPNMKLDPGGVGMGYAVDEALKTLRTRGIDHALVDASGDIGASEAPPGEAGWRIGIAPLSGVGKPSRYVLLKNAALTTSGDAFQAVEIDGRRYSHIVDPRTGLGLTQRSAVTVIAPTCMVADSYATTVSVLGIERGLALIESTPGAAVLIVRQAGERQRDNKIETYESQRFAQYVDEAAGLSQ